MTDLQKFQDLYKSLGIELIVNRTEELFIVKLSGDFYGNYKMTTSDKFKGFFNFYSDIQFDLDGNFISQGFWK